MNTERKEIKILNTQQAEYYLVNGVSPMRLEVGRNNKMIFVYNAEDTKEVWEDWRLFKSTRCNKM